MHEQQLIRQQTNEARWDFAIEDDLDFITSRIASQPKVKGPSRTSPIGALLRI
jgi:hypothetical protein